MENPNVFNFPPDNIDPKKKGYDWQLQWVMAANAEGQSYMPGLMGNVLYRRLEEIRSYGLGKQPISKYKRKLPVDSINNVSDKNHDWSVVPVICRFREIIISRLMQREYDVQAFAIDPLAKTQEDTIYNEMKVKVILREEAKKMGSRLAEMPMLQKQQGEPEDLGELAMQAEFGYKDTLCMEAEEGISLIQQQNNIFERRKRAIENLVDYGLGGYTTWIDSNGKVKFRELNTKNLLLSYCCYNDFSDLRYWGEYIQMNLVDLAAWFTPEQLDKIQVSVAGKNNNPRQIGAFRRAWDRHKVTVLDFKFLTYDTDIYKTETDGRDNERFGKTYYENMQFVKNPVTYGNDEIPKEGAQEPIYLQSQKQVLMKCKWIVDTDMMYDWGIAENQTRKISSWQETSLDAFLYAWNFDNMVFSGLTERMIPIADAYYLTWQKLQNLKMKLIPYLIELDLNAIESTVLGAGGQKMTYQEIIDFAFSNFIVVTRKSDLMTGNPNFKAVQIQASGQLQAFVHLYEDLQFCMQQLYDLTGLNQITAAATPNPKTLTPGYENANIGTDNAIYLLGVADRNLMLRLSDSIFSKIQIAVKMGKLEGIYMPLGAETAKFLSINPDISLIELGIFLVDAPTNEERNLLYQELFQKEMAGLIMPHDRIVIRSMKNLKQAWRYLSYIVNKRQEEQRAFEMQKIQQQNQGAAQAGMVVEQEKQKTIMMQGQIDMEKINLEMGWLMQIELLKKQSDQIEGRQQADAKVIGNKLMADAKIIGSQIMANAKKESASKAD